jgi:hypothetical protein
MCGVSSGSSEVLALDEAGYRGCATLPCGCNWGDSDDDRTFISSIGAVIVRNRVCHDVVCGWMASIRRLNLTRNIISSWYHVSGRNQRRVRRGRSGTHEREWDVSLTDV